MLAVELDEKRGEVGKLRDDRGGAAAEVGMELLNHVRGELGQVADQIEICGQVPHFTTIVRVRVGNGAA